VNIKQNSRHQRLVVDDRHILFPYG